MLTVTASIQVIAEKGIAKITLEPIGHSEFEHELLAQIFGSTRSVTIIPRHKGELLAAEFAIVDPKMHQRAARALENRKRKRDGRMTMEEEEAEIKRRDDQAKANDEERKRKEQEGQ